jgi:hypothetical protein
LNFLQLAKLIADELEGQTLGGSIADKLDLHALRNIDLALPTDLAPDPPIMPEGFDGKEKESSSSSEEEAGELQMMDPYEDIAVDINSTKVWPPGREDYVNGCPTEVAFSFEPGCFKMEGWVNSVFNYFSPKEPFLRGAMIYKTEVESNISKFFKGDFSPLSPLTIDFFTDQHFVKIDSNQPDNLMIPQVLYKKTNSAVDFINEMDATVWLKFLYNKIGPSFHLGMWAYMLELLARDYDSGSRRKDYVYYGNISGAYTNEPIPGRECFKITGLSAYLNNMSLVTLTKPDCPLYKNSLPKKWKTRCVMYHKMGMDFSPHLTLPVVGTAMATVYFAMMALAVNYGFEASGVFNTPPHKGERRREKREKHRKRLNKLSKQERIGHYVDNRGTIADYSYAWVNGMFQTNFNPTSEGIFQSNDGSEMRALAILMNQYSAKFIFDNGDESEVYVTMMDQHMMAFPWHAYNCMISGTDRKCIRIDIYPEYSGSKIDEESLRSIIKTCIQIDLTKFTILRVAKNRDLGYVYFHKAPLTGVRSLWALVPSREDFDETKIISGARRYRRVIQKGRVMACHTDDYLTKMVNKGRTMQIKDYRDSKLMHYLMMEGDGIGGDCGRIVCAHNNPKPFLGQHMGSFGSDGMVTPIFSEDKDLFNGKLQGLIPDVQKQISPNFDAPHIPGAKCIGKWTGKDFSSPLKSSMQLLLPGLLKDFPEEAHFPAPLTREGLANRNAKVHNYGPTPHLNDDRMLDPAWAKDFFHCPRVCHQWDFEKALFGDPNASPPVPSMATTSKFVGYAFPDDKKKELVDFANRTFHLKLKERVEMYLALADEGPVKPLCVQFGKDELLEPKKVFDQIMPRIINGHDLAYNIFLRMLTGDYMDQKIKHPGLTSSALGVDPMSTDWQCVKNMSEVHPNNMCGDFTTQEGTMPGIFAPGYATHIDSYYDNDPQQKRRLFNAILGMDGYYFLANGHIYETLRGHSSGHFNTADYNGFQVEAGHKYIFEEVTDEIYKDQVAGKFMGDDSRVSVADKVADNYNMQVLQVKFKEIFGMTYTSPDKTATEMPKFIEKGTEFDTFLGRGFKEINERTVGPLRKSAIISMLAYSSKPPTGMSQMEINQQRATAACKEAALYGKEYYDNLLARCKCHWAKKPICNGVIQKPPSYPSYENIWRVIKSGWSRNDWKYKDSNPYFNVQ